MGDKIEVTIAIDDKKVTLAGPEAFVRAEVQRLTDMLASNPAVRPPSPASPNLPASISGDLPATEKQFMAAKQPSGHSETVALLGYFLTKGGQDEFTADDIRRAYARAGARPPKVMSQALRDAKNLHDYLEPGTGKGTFRLSLHGERTVEFDLPRK